jgi:hypothetical protein
MHAIACNDMRAHGITCYYMPVMACNNMMSECAITCMCTLLHCHYMHVMACNDLEIACNVHACNGHAMHVMACNNINRGLRVRAWLRQQWQFTVTAALACCQWREQVTVALTELPLRLTDSAVEKLQVNFNFKYYPSYWHGQAAGKRRQIQFESSSAVAVEEVQQLQSS